jgi:hypothetical protein
LGTLRITGDDDVVSSSRVLDVEKGVGNIGYSTHKGGQIGDLKVPSIICPVGMIDNALLVVGRRRQIGHLVRKKVPEAMERELKDVCGSVEEGGKEKANSLPAQETGRGGIARNVPCGGGLRGGGG